VPFTPKTWVIEKNPLGPPADPKKATPIGAGLNDLESRIAAASAASQTYADAILGQIPLVVNLKTYGAKGDGVTDDSTAFQNAINAAIVAALPLYLPPGEYKTTKEIKANTEKVEPSSKFCMFGSGPTSVIVPEKSTYDCLVVGPGSEGSGVGPGGYLRDFKISGGNQTITTKGTGKGNGTAALKLNGQRMMDLTNVEIRGKHDIGVDLVNNCYGSSFRNCRIGFESCRVGVNLRKGEESGEDITFADCWISGEVAAIHAASSGKNYRVIGGQLTAGRQLTEDEDNRGVVILNKDYTTGEVIAGGEVHMQLQTSFEFFPHVWAIRSFAQVRLDLRSSFNPGGSEGKAIGFFKGAGLLQSEVTMNACNIHNGFSKPAAEMVVLEGTNTSFCWIENNSYGIYTDGTGETHAEWNPMFVRAKLSLATGILEGGKIGLGKGLMIESVGEAIKWSRDWGVTWKYLTPEGKTYASANTLTLDAGMALGKITGTTEIKKINATNEGHLVTLKFAEALTVKNGENLKLREDMATTANSTLTLSCDGTNWYEVSRDTYQKAVAPTALEAKAEKTEVEPSATRTTMVTGRVETAATTRTVIKILVGATVVVELNASAAASGKSLLPFCFAVPAGAKWKWEKVEGTVETNGFKFSNTVL
jgi:Pectate lyase superfamily protein